MAVRRFTYRGFTITKHRSQQHRFHMRYYLGPGATHTYYTARKDGVFVDSRTYLRRLRRYLDKLSAQAPPPQPPETAD